MPYLGRMSTQQTEPLIPEWTLGDRLRKARETTGLSQRNFAERIHVDRNTVSNAETDRVKVRPITLTAWSLATGVPVNWLLTGASNPPTDPTDRYLTGILVRAA